MNFDEEIEQHKKAIEKLELEKEAYTQKESEELYELAEKVHKEFCNLPHEDYCGWYYEKNDWTRYAHAEWLEKAKLVKTIMEKYNLTFEQFVEIKKVI